VQQRSGSAEGQRAHDAERTEGHPVAERVAAHDMHPADGSSAHLTTEVFRPLRVALQRNDFHAAPSERERAGAAARADLDHEITGSEGRFGDQRVGEVRLKEVLPETAPSLVSGCPLARGHGRSPLHP
jgi:hypothetical protein